MRGKFRWNEWNLDHAAGHGVTPDEAESVVRDARPPYPEDIGDGKYRVYGRGSGGRILHVIFVLDKDGTIYVIHARPVENKKEKRRVRRRRK